MMLQAHWRTIFAVLGSREFLKAIGPALNAAKKNALNVEKDLSRLGRMCFVVMVRAYQIPMAQLHYICMCDLHILQARKDVTNRSISSVWALTACLLRTGFVMDARRN
jgi:hypothetical protein